MRATLAPLVATTVILVGCTSNDNIPEASFSVQDHIAHVTTAWKDTPDGRGLLPTAIAEATIANLHAGLAVQSSDDLEAIKLHAVYVLHAIDPATAEGGPGLGYGLKAAASGVATHTRLAADTPGASDNVLTHAEHVITSTTNVLSWADEAQDLAAQAAAATDVDAAAAIVAELKARTDAIVKGVDANGDGEITWEVGEGGLRQAEKHMQLMTEGEEVTG